MKKFGIVLMATILALFINPFGQNISEAASLESGNYQPGTYDITAKALHASKDEASGAAPFISEQAKLVVGEKDFKLIITTKPTDLAMISALQVEGVEPVRDGETWSFTLSSIQPILKATVQYEVPSLNMKHDVPFRFSLAGLDEIPVVQPPQEGPEEPVDPVEPEEPKEEAPQKIDNGYYTASASYLHASKDEPSSMGRYLSESLFFNVQGDQIELTVAVNDHKTVTALTIDGKKAIVSKVDGNTRYETFNIANTTKPVVAYVEYEAPYGNTVHKGNASFRVAFDANNLQASSAEQQPGKNISAEDEQLKDGLYSINASFINPKNNQASAMARYLGDIAYLSIKNGKATVYLLIADKGTVTKLKVNDQDAVEEIVNGQKALVGFTLPSLEDELEGYAEYQAPFNGQTHYGNATFAIVLDQASVQPEKSLPFANEVPTEVPEEEVEEEPVKEEKPVEKPSVPTVDGYSIKYVIKHATTDEVSSADNFFVKPGILLKKNGKNYLQLTVNNWSMIGWLKVNNQAVTVVEENKGKDTAVIQFEVPANLSEIVQLSMQVTVPGLYETTHDARLVMDASSLIADESDTNYVVHVPSTGGSSDDVEKPNLDGTGQIGQTEEITSGQTKPVGQKNPQTGDRSQVVLFTSLLLGSLAMLAIQYRRRYIQES